MDKYVVIESLYLNIYSDPYTRRAKGELSRRYRSNGEREE